MSPAYQFFWLIVVLPTSVVLLGNGNVAARDTRRVLREAVACGPNSVVAFLAICQKDVNCAAIDAIPCGAEGASMLALRDACIAAGVPVEIRKYEPHEFEHMATPAIVQSKRASDHHFFVVFNVTTDGIHTIDGTTGLKEHIRRSRLDTYLTGFALVRKRSLTQILLDHSFLAILVVDGLIFVSGISYALPRMRHVFTN